MNGSAFLDTNVLVYANDTAQPGKQQTARTLLKDLLRSDSGVIPVRQAARKQVYSGRFLPISRSRFSSGIFSRA